MRCSSVRCVYIIFTTTCWAGQNPKLQRTHALTANTIKEDMIVFLQKHRPASDQRELSYRLRNKNRKSVTELEQNAGVLFYSVDGQSCP